MVETQGNYEEAVQLEGYEGKSETSVRLGIACLGRTDPLGHCDHAREATRRASSPPPVQNVLKRCFLHPRT